MRVSGGAKSNKQKNVPRSVRKSLGLSGFGGFSAAKWLEGGRTAQPTCGADMADSTWWWLLVGVLVALELLSGTFYLLMLALGAAVAAVAAHTGVPLVAQLIIASVAGSVSVAVWHQIKKRQPGDPSARSLRSVNLDVGEIIQVNAWLPDGSAQVMYRGASWSVIQRPGNALASGSYRVTELVGSRLLVEKV